MEREVNFLVLRYLENYLSEEDYEKLKEKIVPKLDLPKIYNWSGNRQALGFEQLCHDRSHFPSKYLVDVFRQLAKSSKIPMFALDNIGAGQESEEESSLVVKRHELPFALKNRSFQRFPKKNSFHHSKLQKMSGGREFFSKFERMKTVYGHANLGEQPMSISCVEFDRSNKYLITGSDDRLIKVWLVSNGSLQGVLHGHADVIMDLQISNCNRYIISSGKEGVINIWDLKNLKHLQS